MDPRTRRLALIIGAFGLVVVLGTAGLYYLAPGSGPPGSLPIPAGTVFSQDDIHTWAAQFMVPEFPMRIVGAWAASDGEGWAQLIVVNGTVTRPSDALYHCPLLQHWDRSNGTIDVPVNPEPHTMYWGYCFGASRITVTSSIRVAAFGLGG